MNEDLPYSVGALLYCPATNCRTAEQVVSEAFGKPYSLALCLEDSIADRAVEKGEAQVKKTLEEVQAFRERKAFYLPKIFIRVREPEQVERLAAAIDGDALFGFIFPKFNAENAGAYLDQFQRAKDRLAKRLYMMPILENGRILDLKERRDELYVIKELLDKVSGDVLNIRVGGNDLCNAFGLRRRWSHTIYDIGPVADILRDIVSVFGRDYVVSGPVWEYFEGEHWQEGLERELALDQLNGFLGKTVIHPRQIGVVNESMKVSEQDLEDALRILNWDGDRELLVEKNSASQRMTEVKTHGKWAKKIRILSRIYGVKG